MLNTALLLTGLNLVLPQDAPRIEAPVQHMAEVKVGPRQLRRLNSLDLDVAHLDLVAGRAEVIVVEEDLESLAASGLEFEVTIRDLASFYASRLEEETLAPGASNYGGWLSPPFGSGGMGGYYTLAQIESVLDQMRSAYPGLISARSSIGTSIQGRDLWMVRISDNPDVDENEPEIRIDALHHAREPQGMQCTLWFMLYLLEEYGSDPLATYLVNERELYFIPCVNPDGYEYNRQQNPGGGGLWRKNRRNNGGGSYGVDLNRNYPFKWGYDNNGSSTNPDSEVYRGTSAASEPEVQAMAAFISAHSFETALSVHTYSNLWLSPWGYDALYPPDWNQFDEIGSLATQINGYVHGPAAVVLYEANGVTIDYDYGQHGTLSWTPEIGSSNDGFWPSQSRIVPLAEENLLAFIRTALAGGAWVRGKQVTATDAGDADGSFEAGEPVDFTALVRNSGTLDSGLVSLTLSTTSPFATVTVPNTSVGSVQSFSDGVNLTPLELQIDPGTPPGTAIPYILSVEYGGWSQDYPGELAVGTVVTVASYDFEANNNQGWSVGNPNDATTGTWIRVDPNGTAAQPEDDHTEGSGTRCWVTGQGSPGGSVGENDVDSGSTTLVSPIFDLSGGALPRIRYWRWYSNDEGASPQADIFEVDVSNDGGASWVNAETVGPTGAEASGGWYEVVLELDSILSVTDQMRIRFIASDLGSGSIVEAAIDDIEVTYVEGSTCPPPTNYCQTSANSAGPGALISWGGSTDVTDSNFDLFASGSVPNQFGLFFYGYAPGQAPVGNGFLCISGSFYRLSPVKADGSGTAAFSVDFSNLPNNGPLINGTTAYFQWWNRDPGVGATYNFSDGLEVLFCAE